MIENNRISFRPMRKDDLDSVMVIDRLSFRMPWPESAYRHDLSNNPNAILWVAEEYFPDKGSNVIGMIHPDYRGKGIAANLLQKVLFEAFKSGARRAILEVRASNQIAQSLYEGFGFEVVTRRRRYYRDNNEDALLMNLDNLEDLINRVQGIQERRTDFLVE
jgi:ribosomal-protein-alanine N-acetyltransferase